MTAFRVRCDYLTQQERTSHLEELGLPAEVHAQELDQLERTAVFTVAVSVVVDDGREVPWREDSHLTVGACGPDIEALDVWAELSVTDLVEALRGSVTSTVADDWRRRAEVAEQLAGLGVPAAPDELANLPIELRFSDRLRDRLGDPP